MNYNNWQAPCVGQGWTNTLNMKKNYGTKMLKCTSCIKLSLNWGLESFKYPSIPEQDKLDKLDSNALPLVSLSEYQTLLELMNWFKETLQ